VFLNPPLNFNLLKGDIAHGTVACSFGSTFGSVCTYQCNLGYTPIGATEIQCGRDRSWNDFPPFCQILRCDSLAEPSNGRMFCVSDNTFGSECAFSCNMGYMLRGTASRTCGADQKWSGVTSSCVAVQCEAISEPEYGNMICSKDRNFGSVCTIQCDSGYDLIGPRQRACGAEGRWSGSESQIIEDNMKIDIIKLVYFQPYFLENVHL
jgi:selectin